MREWITLAEIVQDAIAGELDDRRARLGQRLRTDFRAVLQVLDVSR